MPVNQLCCCVQAVQEGFCGSRTQSAELAMTLNGKDYVTSAGIDPIDDVTMFRDSDPIVGKVEVTLRKSGSKLEHVGLKAELYGVIEFPGVKTSRLFMNVEKQLCAAGELYRNTTYDIVFEGQTATPADGANGIRGVTRPPYETYHGSKVQLRYYVRVTLQRRAGDVTVQQEVSILVPSSLPEVTRNVKTEIGMGEALHLELECNKWKYHLQDIIYGSINFLSVGTEVTGVLIQILRRETTAQQGQSPAVPEPDVIATHEVLDGCPQSGDQLPIRLFLKNYKLSPTMRSVEDLFSVKYYLNLVIMDADDNTYFKQQEIKLYRRSSVDGPTNIIGAPVAAARAKEAPAIIIGAPDAETGVEAPTTRTPQASKNKKKISVPITLKHSSVMVTFRNDSPLKLDN